MKPEAQRIAIAKACGLAFHNASKTWMTTREHPSRWANRKKRLPDYLTDLNAMHEAEKVLTKSCAELGVLRNTDEVAHYPTWPIYLSHLCKVASVRHWHGGGEQPVWDCTHATAAQRAEAFLRTLSLWTE